MSVAFRRDSDEEHLEPKFELPIPPGPNFVTPAGLAQIEARVTELQALVEAISLRNRFAAGVSGFDRVRVRHVRRHQNLAGIALGQLRQGRRIGGEANAPRGATK